MDASDDYRRSHSDVDKGRAYDANFARYRWRAYLWEREKKVLGSILDRGLVRSPVRHLDFACGTGRILSYLSSRVGSSTGIDVSPSMLECCRVACPKSKLVQADITKEQVLPSSSFDLITAFRFFPNAQDELRRSALKSLTKLLAPGGILVFNNHKHAGSIAFRFLKKYGRARRIMYFDEVQRLLQGAGMKIVETHSIGCLPAEERVMIFPAFLHDVADRVGEYFDVAKNLGQDQIYVCERA